MRIIDLKKIYEDKFFETMCRHTPGPNPEGLPHCSKELIRIHMNSLAADAALIAMKEACKEVLELASENAVLHIRSNWGKLNSLPDKSDNHKTKPFFGIEHHGHGDCTYEYITPDKQSIKNTINQVK